MGNCPMYVVLSKTNIRLLRDKSVATSFIPEKHANILSTEKFKSPTKTNFAITQHQNIVLETPQNYLYTVDSQTVDFCYDSNPDDTDSITKIKDIHMNVPEQMINVKAETAHVGCVKIITKMVTRGSKG